jgi:polysaccharide chain length determinant protein (PEP-CTERM system associated)
MKNLAKLGPLDYYKILKRRWIYILVGFFLGGLGAAGYAWRTPDVFRSESKIMVESALLPQDYVSPSVRQTPQEKIAAIRNIVRSRNFLERMIQEFQLFGYGTRENFSMEGTVNAVSRSIEIINTSLNTFTIAFSSSDPQLSQSVTRRIVEALIQSNASSRRDKAVETDQFLDEQLRKTKQELADIEENIKQFKMAHLGELPEQSIANMTALNRLEAQLIATENELQKLRVQQKLEEQLKAQEQEQMKFFSEDIVIAEEDPVAMEENNSALNSLLSEKQAELAALRAKYTPQYPDVVQLSKEVERLERQLALNAEKGGYVESAAEFTPLGEDLEEADIAQQPEPQDLGGDGLTEIVNYELESIKMDIQQREKERDSIRSQIKQLQARLNMEPAIEKELMALNRERDSLNQQYNNLQKQKFQAQMTANLETNRNVDIYKIIDEANLPEKPSFPNRIQIILLGLCAGLALGIGAALGREALDNTLSSEDEVAKFLKLPVLTTISEIPEKKLRKLIGSVEERKSA